jgi:transposase InsO family protein
LPAPANDIRQTQPLAIVHIDIWGPATVKSIGGARYFLTCYDDFTRKVHLTFLEQKSEALVGIQQYIATVERQTSHKVKVIRSDNGGKFTSNNWSRFIKDNGIEQHFTPPDSHAQNGRVERVHLTILDGVRTILCQSGMGPEFWAEAASYMCYTRNRTPCGPQKRIPEDLWRQHKAKVAHLQPFGCKVFYRDYNNTSKLANRYSEARLMGYVEGTHNHRVWNPIKRKIIKARDVVFVNNTEDCNLIEPPVLELQSPEPDSFVTDKGIDNDNQQSIPSSPRYLLQRLAEIENRRLLQEQSDTTSSDGYQSDSSDDPLLLQPAYANMVTMEPKTVAQAQQTSDWSQWELAMKAELAKMDKYNVWDVINRESVPNIQTVGAKWVYTRKIDGNTGQPSKYKARWVAKGYSQIEGVDFDELFAAVAHKDTIRLFLSIVNHYNWEMDQVDIVAAFLNGDLGGTIYMEPPEGSGIPNSKVL